MSGLVSGMDWKTLVSQLAQAERAPQTRLRSEQSTISQQNSAYASIKTELSLLQNRVNDLNDSALFDSRLASSSDATVASSTAGAGTAVGSYSFTVTQLATAAKQLGAAGIGSSLSPTNDVSGLVLGSASFATAVTAGTITVNGKRIDVATTDTLQSVFDKINTATNGEVTASYDAATDKISLASANPIILGSAVDTSNFLQAARLANNGTGTVTSSAELGGISLAASLESANLGTPIVDGGSGTGEFKINGVSINFSTTDSIGAVLKKINNSAAGVTASYDAVNDRFQLANKTTGDVGVALEDVSGNFLAATGLTGGTLSRGQNLIYSVDGGGELTSQSNTISDTSSGIPGLAVTVLSKGTTTVTVASDTAKIKTVINSFITEYNKVQSIIDTQTASSTDAQGKVTAGLLAGDGDADSIATQLRRIVTGEVPGLSSALNQLEELGIVSNGNDNSITLSDETKLDDALSNNLTAVRSIFTDSTNGLTAKLTAFLNKTVGDNGTLVAKQARLTKQSTDIDTQIADLERIVQADSDRMTQSFIAMESAQAQINQQLKYLQNQFGGSSSSSK